MSTILIRQLVPAPLVTATAISSSAIQVSTAADYRAVSYKWYRDQVFLVQTTDPTYTDSGLGSNETHAYTVAVVDANAQEGPHGAHGSSATTLGDTTAPTAPGALTFASITSSGFTATWTAATDNVGVVGYETSVDGATAIPRGLVLTQAFSGSASTTYSIRVRAYDAAGNRGPYVTASVTTSAAAGGFARKPVIATPSLPTPLRQLYVDAAAGSGGIGTIGSPFNTVTAAQNTMQAGDEINYKGTFDTTSNERFGMVATSGTSTNPIVHRAWPGFSPSFKLGGGVNEYNTVTLNDSFHWFYGLKLYAQTGADGGKCVSLFGTDNKFISCEFASSLWRSNAARNEIWDCRTTGDSGSRPSNSGDTIWINGPDNRIMRLDQRGSTCGHSAFMVQNPSGALTVTGTEIFDCDIQNAWAGGLQLLVGSGSSHVHWNRLTLAGTLANPSGYPVGSREGCEMASEDNIFEFNTISGGAGSGLSMQNLIFGGMPEYCKRNLIRHNVITANGNMGLAITSAQGVNARTACVNNIITNNIIYDNSRNGVGAGDGSTGWYGVYYAVVLGQYNSNSGNGGTAWATDQFYGNVFANNVFAVSPSDTTTFMLLIRTADQGNNKDYTSAQLAAAEPLSINNILATNPLFVSSSDYHLQAASPAVDAGKITSGIAYLGAAPDIGVYEYGGTD